MTAPKMRYHCMYCGKLMEKLNGGTSTNGYLCPVHGIFKRSEL